MKIQQDEILRLRIRVDEVEKLKQQVLILERQLKESEKYLEFEEKCGYLSDEQHKLE